MRQKKAKMIRRVAKAIAKTMETVYIVGKQPDYYYGETIETVAGIMRYGDKINPGIPTILEPTCFRAVCQMLKPKP